MDVLLKAFVSFRDVHFHVDDDLTDRLSHKYTTALLVTCALVASLHQYFGQLIECHCTERCQLHNSQYTNAVCWVSDTYYVSPEHRLPDSGDEREAVPRVVYYQWTPLILLALAATFTLPWLLWKVVNRRLAGLSIGALTDVVRQAQYEHSVEARMRSMRYATYVLARFCESNARKSRHRGPLGSVMAKLACWCCCFRRWMGSGLTAAFVVVKLCYAVNATVQIFMLDAILGFPYHMFGVHAVRHFTLGEPLSESLHFPRVTLCDYHIRQMGNVQPYTVQCVLPLNMVNEKIFALLWFWFAFVALASTLNCVTWLVRFLAWPEKCSFVKHQLRAVGVVHLTSGSVKQFCRNYLRKDGLLILHLISENAGHLTSAELLLELWDKSSNLSATQLNSRAVDSRTDI